MFHFFIFIYVLFSLSLPSTFATSPSNSKQLQSIQSQLEKNQKKLTPIKKEKKHTQYQLAKINREISYNKLKLSRSKKKLTDAEKKEKHLRSEIKSVEKQSLKLQTSLKNRINHLYKYNPLNLLELMISTNSWTYDTNSNYFFSKIMKQDISLLDQVHTNHRLLTKKQQDLKQQTKTIKSLHNSIINHKKNLASKKIKRKQKIASLESEIQTLVLQNKELERLSKELTKLIKKESLSKKFYGTGTMQKPVKGWISSRFGMRKHPIFKRKIKHNGIDIAAPKGYKIRAADSGKVIFSGNKGGYGKSVLIYHGVHPTSGKSLSTFYAHQSRILVKKGDIVSKGEEIGWVGSTGYATGPHLHFEVKENGKHVDPMKFLKI